MHTTWRRFYKKYRNQITHRQTNLMSRCQNIGFLQTFPFISCSADFRVLSFMETSERVVRSPLKGVNCVSFSRKGDIIIVDTYKCVELY